MGSEGNCLRPSSPLCWFLGASTLRPSRDFSVSEVLLTARIAMIRRSATAAMEMRTAAWRGDFGDSDAPCMCVRQCDRRSQGCQIQVHPNNTLLPALRGAVRRMAAFFQGSTSPNTKPYVVSVGRKFQVIHLLQSLMVQTEEPKYPPKE